MSTILPLGLQEAQDGKGLGLFAPSHFRPGSVLFEDEALFRRYTRELILPNVKFADIYSKVMQWYGDLLEKSATKEWLEWLLFRKPSLNMLFDIAQTRSSLEMHSVEFSCLDESTKIRNLYGYLNYNDGARIMNDVNDCLLGFSVHASLLNHSCNPNAILAIHTYVDGQVQKADWSTGTIQIRALKHIGLRDEITISYDHSLRTSPQARRLFLQGAYRFRCECQMCRHETPLSRAQFSTLHNGLSSLYDMSKSRSQVYRTAHRFCRNARAVGWNDCQILDILEYARCVAVQTRDRIRAMYWASNAWNWCKIFLGEEHEKSRRYLRLYDELVVLGVPTMITEGTLDVRPLMCMIEHPDTDDTYYFLRCDDGVLSEVGESENRLLSNWASERQDSGWDEKVLKDVISMFDNPMLELAAEAAYESLLRELNAVEQVSRKKKTKKGRKKANQAADSTPNVQDRQADSSRSTTSEPPAGPPASSSISANAQMHPPNVPDQENIGFQGMSLLEDLGPFEWQQVESKKGSKKAKGKQRALEQMATNPHVDGGVARGTRSLETRVSESSLLPSASPVSINLATHDWEQVDFKEDFNKTKGKQRVAANASTMTTYSLARAHLGTLTVETGVHKCASPAGNLFTKPFTPPSSLAITPTSQKTPLSPSQVGQNAANTDPMTPPDSTEKRSANLPAPKGCLVVSPPTPVNRITAVPMPPESQTARSISPPLRPPTPQVNLPVAKDLPIHLMPPQSLPSPQIKLPVVGRAPVPSYQFVRFGTELESREGCTTSESGHQFRQPSLVSSAGGAHRHRRRYN